MKIQSLDKASVSLEMSRDELLDVVDIVFTARSFYEALDPAPYELTEERVTRCADKLENILERLQSDATSG